MRRVTIILGVVLAAQLVLAAVLHYADGLPGSAAQLEPLMAFERDAVEAVQIVGAEGSKLRLVRGNQGWKLPESGGFPVAEQAIERLLGELADFDQRLPVARSESARERFHVASDNYERRVRLILGQDRKVTIYFGSSAGTGRVYARAKGQTMIYEVSFPLWHASTDPSSWRNTSLIQIDPAAVAQAELSGFIVRRADDGTGWKLLVDGQPVKTADPGKAAQLIQRLAQPNMEAVSRKEAPQGEPTLAYTLTTKEGETIRFRYYAGGDKYAYLYRSDQPWRYRVDDKQVAKIEKASPETLLAETGTESGSSAGSTGKDGDTANAS